MKRYRQRHFGQPEVRSPRWSEAQRAGRQARRDAEAAERGPLFQRLNTEIDALAALRPEVLSGIVEAAIAPFHDFTLVTRIEMAAEQWRADVNATLQAEPRYAAAHRRVSALRSVLEAAAEALSQAQDEAEADFAEIPTPEFELPEPEIADEAVRQQRRLGGGDPQIDRVPALGRRRGAHGVAKIHKPIGRAAQGVPWDTALAVALGLG